MARHFFTGGMMPSDDRLPQWHDDLAVSQRWRVGGMQYARTSEAWLANLDAHRDAVLSLFADAYGGADAALWLQRWRLFFLACAELFAYRRGTEWFVAHLLMAPR